MSAIKPKFAVGDSFKFEGVVWTIVSIDYSFVTKEVFTYKMEGEGREVNYSENYIYLNMIRL